MLFSVVIPTYNGSALLRETLESVFAQTFADYEVIVVDDGSTDETISILREYPSSQVLRQDNKGPGVARNLGIAAAQGEYLAFLDSDDLWFPWSLATYAFVIQKHNNPAFIAGKPFRFSSRGDFSPLFEKEIRTDQFPDYLASGAEWRWWGVSSFVVQRDAIQRTSGFAEVNMNGEDADLAMKLGDAPRFVQVASPSTFAYREHGSNLTLSLLKNLMGVRHQIRSEKRGDYPGGSRRARERWRIITRHVRPVSLACSRQGMYQEAWELYRVTLFWHLCLGRWKYLVGFPLKLFPGAT